MTSDRTSYPLVSVIIPAFNCKDCIDRAIGSVLAQNYRPIEVIVVDDGSTDGTGEKVKTYGPSVRLVPQDNTGPAAARNRGIGESNGEFIAFLDADDEWLPRRLERCMEPMLRDENVGMTYCWTFRQFPDGRRIIRNLRAEQQWSFPRILWRSALQHTSATICRRSVLGRVGCFDATLKTREDRDLWIRMSEESEVAAIEEPLSIQHVREGSASRSTDDEQKRIDYFKIVENALRRRPERYEPHRNTLYAEAYHYWGVRYYTALDHRLARKYFLQSLKYEKRMRTFMFVVKTCAPARLMAFLRRFKAGE